MNQQVKPPAGWTEIEPEFDHQRQTFQRRRDGLVVAIERDGRRSQNIVTLPENYYQDNKIIDCIEIGVEPEDAAETAREWMEHNNATTGATPTEYLSAVNNTDDTPTVNGVELDSVVGVANAFRYLDEPYNAGDITVRESEDLLIIQSRQTHFGHMDALLQAQKQGHISIQLITAGTNHGGDPCLKIEVVGGADNDDTAREWMEQNNRQ